MDSLRERSLKEARERIKERLSKDDVFIVRLFALYKLMNKEINSLFELLYELILLYLPEEEGDIDIDNIKDKIDSILNSSDNGLGRSPNQYEIELLRKLRDTYNSIYNTIDSIKEAIEVRTRLLMPNTTVIIEPMIAAELLYKAGSLERLYKMPSSTIQVLGAEKALFRHLRYKSKPPKYGILYKIDAISKTDKKKAGKLSRLYANLITIAIRADYNNRDIKEFLKDKLNRSIERINSSKKSSSDSHKRKD
ncbi:MAG: putative NOP5 family protein [Candidatus Micrarchaeota archaeon]|nr:MAG: putative NOP5 family protein [Candidatus Micrarchaeota archaeon]